MKIRHLAASSAAVLIAVLLAGCSALNPLAGYDEGFLPLKRPVPAPIVTLSASSVEYGSGTTLGSIAVVENGTLAQPELRVDLLDPGAHSIALTALDLNGNPCELGAAELTVTDRTAPLLYASSTLYADLGDWDYDVKDDLFYGDKYTKNVSITVQGGWSVGAEGSYPLTITATDEAGNSTTASVTLVVRTPSGGSEEPYNPPHYDFGQFAADYAQDGVVAGIDVSTWQGEIDWAAVKADGVEFAILRVGFQRGYGGEYALDDTFAANLAGAKAVGMPLGVYFYSYAVSPEEAREQASWVLEQLEGAALELPIAFDWENWGSFSGRGLSFSDMDRIAAAYIEVCEQNGYDGMLYGSKNYLTDVWDASLFTEIWLAHYVDESSYVGPRMLWQASCEGGVDGIDAYVDLNLLYLDRWPLGEKAELPD